eukprot:RCo050191
MPAVCLCRGWAGRGGRRRGTVRWGAAVSYQPSQAQEHRKGRDLSVPDQHYTVWGVGRGPSSLGARLLRLHHYRHRPGRGPGELCEHPLHNPVHRLGLHRAPQLHQHGSAQEVKNLELQSGSGQGAGVAHHHPNPSLVGALFAPALDATRELALRQVRPHSPAQRSHQVQVRAPGENPWAKVQVQLGSRSRPVWGGRRGGRGGGRGGQRPHRSALVGHHEATALAGVPVLPLRPLLPAQELLPGLLHVVLPQHVPRVGQHKGAVGAAAGQPLHRGVQDEQVVAAVQAVVREQLQRRALHRGALRSQRAGLPLRHLCGFPPTPAVLKTSGGKSLFPKKTASSYQRT